MYQKYFNANEFHRHAGCQGVHPRVTYNVKLLGGFPQEDVEHTQLNTKLHFDVILWKKTSWTGTNFLDFLRNKNNKYAV